MHWNSRFELVRSLKKGAKRVFAIRTVTLRSSCTYALSVLKVKKFMELKNAPSFITLDIDVFSEESLDLMADYFDKSAIVLAHQKVDNLFFLRIEPRHNSHDELAPENCAQTMLELVSELPEEISGMWNRAKSKTFDFGFESGNAGPCFQSVISTETLKNISKIGASFTITIYQIPEEEMQAT